jgi:hypothetical protein
MKTIQEIFNEMNNLMKEFDEAIAETKCDEPTKEEEFVYPLCVGYHDDSLIALYYGLNRGKILFDCSGSWIVGSDFNNWIDHTDTEIWKQIPYNKERELYHKQRVYCWNTGDTHAVDCRFYDAINDNTWYFYGKPDGHKYDNYSATMPEHMLTAHKTLKD